MGGVFTRAPALQFLHLPADTETLLQDERVLVVIGSGLSAATVGASRSASDSRLFELGFPVLPSGAQPMRQVVRSGRRVQRVQHQALRGATDGDYLFLTAQLDAEVAIEVATSAAYMQLLAAVQQLGFSHLIRVWNCLRDINFGEGDAEQYRQFCIGRFEAFSRHARAPTYPAASALGLRDAAGRVGLLAARFPAAAIENPQQVSAFRYPRVYGPTSPSFSRASLLRTEAGDVLLVSGTAAITGHESMHVGHLDAQLRLCLANIAAVVVAAEGPPAVFSAAPPSAAMSAPPLADIQLRIYLRHADSLASARASLAAALRVPFSVEWLQADICRQELLVEVEAVLCWANP